MIAASAAALIGIVVIAAITAIYAMLTRPEATPGRHAHGTVAPDPMLLHALHHEPVWVVTLPAAGLLPMLPPDPPPDDTRPQPVVYTAWGGRTVDQMVEEIFTRACAEVIS